MTTRITFTSSPHIDGDTGAVVPGFRNVHLLVNGTPWMMGFTSRSPQAEAYSIAHSALIRTRAFPGEIVSMGGSPEQAIKALEYLLDGCDYPVWER